MRNNGSMPGKRLKPEYRLPQIYAAAMPNNVCARKQLIWRENNSHPHARKNYHPLRSV